jgi:conjugal transfer/entry exclusion protein
MTTMFAKGIDDDMPLVEGLKNDVQALKNRCDMLEKIAKDLQSVCDMHKRTLEAFRQHIINLHRHQGTLDSSYQGEEFEVIPQ